VSRILVGTCSWTDPSLIESGRFYPPGVSSAADRLRFYAAHFPLVEVDATYYAPPDPRTARLWVERSPDDFVFDVKAFGLLTGHAVQVGRLPRWLRERLPDDLVAKGRFYRRGAPDDVVEAVWQLHRDALAPLQGAGKLGAVLFQFPPWFVRSAENEAYLRELPGRLPGLRVAVEFRGGGWMKEESAAGTLSTLEETGLAYVTVDEPQGFRSSTPPLAAATTDLAYLRLHGRNADTWEARTPRSADRFKYLYSEEELRGWIPSVHELAERAGTVHVLFNNNFEDWGLRNARRMAQLLGVARDPSDRPGEGGGGAPGLPAAERGKTPSPDHDLPGGHATPGGRDSPGGPAAPSGHATPGGHAAPGAGEQTALDFGD